MATKKKSKEKTKGVNRRGFLKGAGYTAAGAAIVGSGLIPASGKPAQTSDPAAAMQQTITRDGRKITVLGGQSGLSAEEVLVVAQELDEFTAECEVMAETYQVIAAEMGADARLSVNADQLQTDRETLERLFSEDYMFTDPFGVVGDRESTIGSILAGKIRKDSFSYPEETMQIFGDTAVTIGVFEMKGSMKVKYKTSGVVRRRDISGRYRTTHTYTRARRGWVLASSHMSVEPDPKIFTHGHPGEPDETESEG